MVSSQVLPLPASNEVTVAITTDDTPKANEEFQLRTLKRTLALATYYTVVSLAALLVLRIAFKFISDGFVLLLAVTCH